MYLLTPTPNDSTAMKQFLDKFNESQALSSNPLLENFDYDEWLGKVQAGHVDRHPLGCYDAGEGSTFFLAERLSHPTEGPADLGGDDYFKELPMLSNGCALVGVTTLREVEERAAVLSVYMHPAWQGAGGLMLAIKDILGDIVCRGLPYEVILYCVPKEDATACTVLRSCSFTKMFPGLLDVNEEPCNTWRVDLGPVHLLKSHIQEWKCEEG